MVITFATPKGGVGKSTLLFYFALWIREFLKAQAVLVDCDAQRSTTMTNRELPSPFEVFRETSLDRVGDLVLKLSASYDFVLVDAPGAQGDEQENTENEADMLRSTLLTFTDLAVFPLGLSKFDTRAFVNKVPVMLEVARAARGGGLPAAVIVPSKVDFRTRKAKNKELQAFGRSLGIHTIDPGVGHREPYVTGTDDGIAVWNLKGREARKASIEIQKTIAEVIHYGQQQVSGANVGSREGRASKAAANG